MADASMLERDDLSVFVIAGVPKSFKRKLQSYVKAESKADGDVMLLNDELTEWVVARLRGEKRRSWERSPASAALWRAYRALSAARYHLQHHEAEEERVRELRAQVEELWREVSPLFPEEEEGAGAESETAAEGEEEDKS